MNDGDAVVTFDSKSNTNIYHDTDADSDDDGDGVV